MPGLEHYVGQTLDDKYRLEQLLGHGGMGAVYLATHLGTERYVALKLIAPQFMRNEEFVERFKREARAAGRLRHPNVVDVTDFGFAKVNEGQVAYLVMEYLDGCTLGDVLSEEKRLPVEWVVDILEQVCSAVHEAHQLGIVHRDLKPDNIWLEPNRLGGYRIKVLDFGIAKVADITSSEGAFESSPATLNNSSMSASSKPDDVLLDSFELEAPTLFQTEIEEEKLQGRATAVGQARSSLQTNIEEDEQATQLLDPNPSAPTSAAAPATNLLIDDNDGTLLFDEGTRQTPLADGHFTSLQGSALTRVGAIMGTPLYMSPEQCGGAHVDTRSDIYSLGVIAYQMLAGEPPFSGHTSAVMRAHREDTAKHLRDYEAKIPKRVAGVVMAALAKNPDERPQTAFAFSSSLRGQAEGIGALYRRAFSLYSEYFPKFLKLSFLAHLPVIAVSLMMIGLFIAEKEISPGNKPEKIALYCAMALVGLLQIASYFVTAAVISGVTAIIITQLSAAPLRPVKLRTAVAVLRTRWQPFLKTMLMVTWRIILGYILLVVPGVIVSIRYALTAPVVLIENLEKKEAMRRARELASRSWRTVIIVSVIQILIPMVVSILLGRIRVNVSRDLKRGEAFRQSLQQIFSLVNIFIVPLISIVPALLYLKMRQLGGESLNVLLAEFEERDAARSKWQQRMRTRLSLRTSQSQKTTAETSRQ